MLRRPRTVLACVLGSLSVAGLASANVLTLHGGATLDGRVVEQRPNEIVFEHELSGNKIRSTFDRSIVSKLEITSGLGTISAPAAVTSARYGEARGYSRKVAIVVDRSGSMSIGDRWAQALDEVDAILGQLADSVDVGVWAFDRKPQSIFEGSFVKVGRVRTQVRGKLEALGVNLEGYTDLVAALAPSVAASPEAIYLVTDGVPTQGEPYAAFVVKGVNDQLKLLPPPKNVPIHAVQIEGGVYELGDVEDPEGAREILRALASETLGTYRGVVALARPRMRSALRPLKELGHAPDAVTFHLYQTDGSGDRPRFEAGRRFYLRQFVNLVFLVEVEDPALQRGPVVLEYATQPNAPRIELESYPLASVSPERYDEKRDMAPLAAGERDLWESGSTATTASDKRGVLRLNQRIHIVRGLDDRKCGLHVLDGSDPSNAFIKVPAEGGTLHILYRRGNRTFKHVLFIDSPLGGAH